MPEWTPLRRAHLCSPSQILTQNPIVMAPHEALRTPALSPATVDATLSRNVEDVLPLEVARGTLLASPQ